MLAFTAGIFYFLQYPQQIDFLIIIIINIYCLFKSDKTF